jgi:hypothetical protein
VDGGAVEKSSRKEVRARRSVQVGMCASHGNESGAVATIGHGARSNSVLDEQ